MHTARLGFLCVLRLWASPTLALCLGLISSSGPLETSQSHCISKHGKSIHCNTSIQNNEKILSEGHSQNLWLPKHFSGFITLKQIMNNVIALP